MTPGGVNKLAINVMGPVLIRHCSGLVSKTQAYLITPLGDQIVETDVKTSHAKWSLMHHLLGKAQGSAGFWTFQLTTHPVSPRLGPWS